MQVQGLQVGRCCRKGGPVSLACQLNRMPFVPSTPAFERWLTLLSRWEV